MNNSLKIPDDDSFTIHISNSMAIRNKLRAGLVQAQGKDTEKIPMFVSWPEWLEDGIVCLYARDFHHVLCSAIHETAVSLGGIYEKAEKGKEADIAVEQAQDIYHNDNEKTEVSTDQDTADTAVGQKNAMDKDNGETEMSTEPEKNNDTESAS